MGNFARTDQQSAQLVHMGVNGRMCVCVWRREWEGVGCVCVGYECVSGGNGECGGHEENGFVCGGYEEDGGVCGGYEEDGGVCGGYEEDGSVCGGYEEDGSVCGGFIIQGHRCFKYVCMYVVRSDDVVMVVMCSNHVMVM